MVILLALPASQIPTWDFQYDPRACCCDKAGPCPCPDHELPDHEEAASFRACGSGGNFVVVVQAPELGLPPATLAFLARAEPASAPPLLTAPRPAPDVERPRGPS